MRFERRFFSMARPRLEHEQVQLFQPTAACSICEMVAVEDQQDLVVDGQGHGN